MYSRKYLSYIHIVSVFSNQTDELMIRFSRTINIGSKESCNTLQSHDILSYIKTVSVFSNISNTLQSHDILSTLLRRCLTVISLVE